MSYHSVEVMVYQYDKLFGCPNPNPHFYILVGYFCGTVILNGLPWQPAGKFRVPQKYKTVGYGWDTSHPTTISKKFIILIYHYLHAVCVDTFPDDDEYMGALAVTLTKFISCSVNRFEYGDGNLVFASGPTKITMSDGLSTIDVSITMIDKLFRCTPCTICDPKSHCHF